MANKAETETPFADEVIQSVLPVVTRGELVPYTRINDLSEDLRLVPLDDLQGQDLFVFRYDKFHSAENNGDFLTLEVSFVENPEDRFLTNCGGQVAMKKIEHAFNLVEKGEVKSPLVASFRKIQTSSNRSFWVLE